jgi:hypothetical protein
VTQETGKLYVGLSSAYLAGLTVGGGTLTPTFDKNVLSYIVSVGNNVSSVTINAIAENPAAAVSINPSSPVSLSVGDNIVKVKVTAAGYADTEYTITVTRASGNGNSPSGGNPSAPASVEPAEEDKDVDDGETSNTTASWNNSFTDVKASDWFYGDVEFVVKNGLFNGTGADAFSPQTPMTRAMLDTVLHRLAELSAPAGAAAVGDVPAGQWYSEAVAWAAESGIVQGIGGGNFAPNTEISRQDMAVILTRYADATGKQFPVTLQYSAFADDADIADYAKNAVQTLYRGGIVSGKPGNVFDPKGSATRAEVAAMLHRFTEVLK